MKVYLRGLNACVMRHQKLAQYRQFLEANDHTMVDAPDSADWMILWTCAFRADHRDASSRTVKMHLDRYPGFVLVAGCLPAIAPEQVSGWGPRLVLADWKADVGVLDRLFRTKRSLAEFRPVFVQERLCEDAAAYRRQTGRDATFHDQFIKLLVSEGCGFQCAYCSERLAFPAYRSVMPDELERSCRAMVERTGVHDVILVADSLGQYGCDIGTDLPSLVRRLAGVHPAMGFAFNNLNLANFLQFFEAFRALIAEGRVRHVNLPIQSASDRVLARMKRDYRKADIERVFGLFRALAFRAFDTHIIIGFPGEDDRDVDETLALLLAYRPQYVLASRYMESGSAPSAELQPKVPEAAAIERLRRAERTLSGAGIICNADGGSLSEERLKRLHGA